MGLPLKFPFGTPVNRSDPIGKAIANCWRFSEGGGLKAFDIVSKKHGTLVNTPTRVMGPRGRCLNFAAASTQHITLPTGTAQLGTGNCTIIAFVEHDGTNSTRTILSTRDSGAASTEGYALFLQTTNRVGFVVGDGVSGVTITSANNAVSIGWHVVVARFISGVEMRLFLDGVEVASSTSSIVSGDITTTEIPRIGAFTNGNSPFNGRMDSVVFIPGILSVPQIRRLQLNLDSYLVQPRNPKGFVSGGDQTLTTTPAVFDLVAKDATLTADSVSLSTTPAVFNWTAKDATLVPGEATLSTTPAIFTWTAKDATAVPDAVSLATTPAIVTWTAKDATIPVPITLAAGVAIVQWVAKDATLHGFVPPTPASRTLGIVQCASKAQASRSGGGQRAENILPCSPTRAAARVK